MKHFIARGIARPMNRGCNFTPLLKFASDQRRKTTRVHHRPIHAGQILRRKLRIEIDVKKRAHSRWQAERGQKRFPEPLAARGVQIRVSDGKHGNGNQAERRPIRRFHFSQKRAARGPVRFLEQPIFLITESRGPLLRGNNAAVVPGKFEKIEMMIRRNARGVVSIHRRVNITRAQMNRHVQRGFRVRNVPHAADDCLALVREFALELRNDRICVRCIELFERAPRENGDARADDRYRRNNDEREQQEHFQAETHCDAPSSQTSASRHPPQLAGIQSRTRALKPTTSGTCTSGMISYVSTTARSRKYNSSGFAGASSGAASEVSRSASDAKVCKNASSATPGAGEAIGIRTMRATYSATLSAPLAELFVELSMIGRAETEIPAACAFTTMRSA